MRAPEHDVSNGAPKHVYTLVAPEHVSNVAPEHVYTVRHVGITSPDGRHD
jgi:hypothetical protein